MSNTIAVDDSANPAVEMVDIRHLSAEQLARLGVSQIAYVKRVRVDGNTAYAIHAADGTPMALTEDCDVAIAAVHKHEMVATLVH